MSVRKAPRRLKFLAGGCMCRCANELGALSPGLFIQCGTKTFLVSWAKMNCVCR